MSQGEYLAAAYVVVFVVVLGYVAIISAKLGRLQRDVSELVELARQRAPRTETVAREVAREA
jgi:CcmD family protein